MSIVPGGPSPWGRSTLHLRSLLLQAFALSTTFAPRLLCLWWEKGEHWEELIGNLITSEIKAEAVQHLDLGVEERSPGSFHPPTNAGSVVIEDCERWNGLLTEDYNSSAINYFGRWLLLLVMGVISSFPGLSCTADCWTPWVSCKTSQSVMLASWLFRFLSFSFHFFVIVLSHHIGHEPIFYRGTFTRLEADLEKWVLT